MGEFATTFIQVAVKCHTCCCFYRVKSQEKILKKLKLLSSTCKYHR